MSTSIANYKYESNLLQNSNLPTIPVLPVLPPYSEKKDDTTVPKKVLIVNTHRKEEEEETQNIQRSDRTFIV